MGVQKFNGTFAAKALRRWIGSTYYRVAALMGVSTAASTALTGTQEADTAFDVSATIPANTLEAGSVIRFRAQWIHTATTGSETHVIEFKLGTTTIASMTAIDPATNDIGYIEGVIVVRTIGASGTMVATGVQLDHGATGVGTAKPWFLASTAIDTTADLAAAVFIDRQASATDSDSARVDVLVVELL